MSSDKELLDFDPLTGVKTFHIYDEHTDETTIYYEQDVEPILDLNKACQNDSMDKSSDMWLAAKIPLMVQAEWLTKYGIDVYNKDHWDGVKKLLNSSDYRYLRTQEFQL